MDSRGCNTSRMGRHCLARSIRLALFILSSIGSHSIAADYVEIGTSLQFRLMSGDGQVIAGYGGEKEIWTWSREDGFTQVTPTRTNVNVNLNAISWDGSVVVGAEKETAIESFNQAFLWTSQMGSVLLDPTVQFGRSQASGLTNSGTVIGSYGDPAGGGRQVFAWTDEDGMRDLAVPDVPFVFNSPVVSHDGSVIAGAISNVLQPDVTAFVWDRIADQVADLGVLPEYRVSRASDVSSNGAIVVGASQRESGRWIQSAAYRWTADGGTQALGTLPADNSSFARGVSADGRMIFGVSENRTNDGVVRTGVVWDEQLEIHNLLNLVNGHPEIKDTPRLTEIEAVSNDQRTIIGQSGDTLLAIYLDIPLFSAVPEPSSSSLTGLGGLLLVYSLRRRSSTNDTTSELMLTKVSLKDPR